MVQDRVQHMTLDQIVEWGGHSVSNVILTLDMARLDPGNKDGAEIAAGAAEDAEALRILLDELTTRLIERSKVVY